jgi:hypothetical protein
MASFNQSPLGQTTVGLAYSTSTLGIGTISPTQFLSIYVKFNYPGAIYLSPDKTLDNVSLPLDLRPTVGLLYPR